MPVGVRLVGVRRGDHRVIVQSAPDELNAERQLIFAESAGHA